jgi:hypothetical protein
MGHWKLHFKSLWKKDIFPKAMEHVQTV